jgi:hypothetical protein
MNRLPKAIAAQTGDRSPGPRPWQITLLSWVYLLISGFHLLRFVLVLGKIDLLRRLALEISPLYLAVDGLIWGLAGLILALGLRQGKSWSPRAVVVLSLVYTLAFWVDRIWIAEPGSFSVRWPINLFLTIISLGLMMLTLVQKSSQEFFLTNPAKIA